MEEAGSFLYGVLIFNFSMPIVIPAAFLLRFRRLITRKILFLLTSISLCYLGGLIVVCSIFVLEKRYGVYDGTANPSLLGFLSQNILSLSVYALTAWGVSRYFRKPKTTSSTTMTTRVVRAVST